MFLSKRKTKVVKVNPVQERLFNSIIFKCIRLQERWAGFMQRKLERFSIKGKQYLVICFCILFGGYSFYLIAQSLMRPTKKLSIVSAIKKPAHILNSGEPPKFFDAESEYKKIEALKHYRDSINKIYKK